MEPEKWQRIKEIFGAVLECNSDERAAFLESSCGGDEELRAEVESLLLSHREDATELPDPDPQPAPTKIFADSDAMGDRRVGPYRLVREIGRGGMAVVYLAVRDDDQYRKRVAVKFVRRGLDDEEMVRRFRNERQTLAALDHPNIVKLLDGGTTEEGTPWLAMEFVEGVPVDEYCDVHRLPITERLRLFSAICGAVQYAHQNLIIHRDLKPSNILITSDGVPKLLDFGIAKLLNPEVSAQTLLLTQPNARALTPEYASPEQIRGSSITTATDVYSLGVILYYLLSGRPPYRWRTGTPLEIAKAICEDEPEKPSTAIGRFEHPSSPEGSTDAIAAEAISRIREGSPDKLRRRLAGDLDNIVLKALRKEPERRYQSVLQLSDDIRRHLDGLPVTAHRTSFSYRTSKFVRRNRAAVAAGALVVIALVVATAVTSWEAHVANQQKVLAETRFDDVRQLADSFLFDFDDAIRNLRGSTPARELVVQKALDYLNRLSKETRDDPALDRDLAHAWIKVGDIQGYPYVSNLGELPAALESYEKSRLIVSGLLTSHHQPDDVQLLGEIEEKIGVVQLFLGHPQTAVNELLKAIDLLRPLVANPSNPGPALDLIDCLSSLGDAYGHGSALNLGNPDKALTYFRESMAVAQRVHDRHPADLTVLRRKAVAESKIGDILLAQGDSGQAIGYQRQSLADFAAIADADASNARAKRELSVADQRLGDALWQHGDRSEALSLRRKALAISEDLAAADPENAEAQFDLAVALRNLSDALAARHDLSGSVDAFRRAVDLVARISAQEPANLTRKVQLAEGLISFGGLLSRAGRDQEAAQETSRGLAIQRSLADSSGASLGERLAYANSLLTCAPASLRNPAAALRAAREADRLNPNNPDVLATIAAAQFALGDAGAAVLAEEAALTSEKALGPENSAAEQMEFNLKKYRLAAGKLEKP